MATTIMLVEDEHGLADSIATELGFLNYQIIKAYDGQQALDTFNDQATNIDLIILDWMLPKVDGFSVLKRIRRVSQVPIIMLTARTYIGDKVAGLTGGADDYITKPFEMEELIARIEVALRHGKQNQTAKQAATSKVKTVGDLKIDLAAKQVSRHGEIIALTQREYELLIALLQNVDRPCSRDELLDHVWGTAFDGQPNILDVYIRQLRAKIDADPHDLKLIHTVRGTGYMLSANVRP